MTGRQRYSFECKLSTALRAIRHAEEMASNGGHEGERSDLILIRAEIYRMLEDSVAGRRPKKPGLMPGTMELPFPSRLHGPT
jgi:hypothetical protein